MRKFEVTEGFAEVVDAGSAAVLIMLYVRPEARGSGVGGQLLKAVLDTADSEGKPLALQVAGSCGQEHGLTDEQLIGWYGRNGFVHDDRYQHPGRMIREPRNSI